MVSTRRQSKRDLRLQRDRDRLAQQVAGWLGAASSVERVAIVVALGSTMVKRQDVEQLGATLLPDEALRIAGYGGPAKKAGLVLLTDRRLLAVQGAYGMPGSQEFLRSEVSAVDHVEGVLHTRLTLHSTGRSFELTIAPKEAAQRVVNELRRT